MARILTHAGTQFEFDPWGLLNKYDDLTPKWWSHNLMTQSWAQFNLNCLVKCM